MSFFDNYFFGIYIMFRPFLNKFTILNPHINNQIGTISYCKHIAISHFDTIIEHFSQNFKPIQQLKPTLENITSQNQYRNLSKHLEIISKSITKDDIESLKSIVSDNFYRINFNDYNYFKYPFIKTDFLTAYLIIWNYNAETNIHTHPSNGCYILKLDGEWDETIYNSCNIEKRIIKSRDVCFINDEIGSHKVKFLENDVSKIGFSLNIYSPSSKIE